MSRFARRSAAGCVAEEGMGWGDGIESVEDGLNSSHWKEGSWLRVREEKCVRR